MFKKIDTDQALIVQKGLFKPVDVYEGPEGGLYIKIGSGYARIRQNGSTSVEGVALQMLHRDEPVFKDAFGRLCTTGGDGRKPMSLTADNEGRPLLIEAKD
jgi:hypothetical protein